MKRLFFLGAILALIVCIPVMNSCNSAKANKLDAVEGIQPVDVHDIGWRKQFIESLQKLSPAERKTRIDQVVPRLNAQLAEKLWASGYKCKIKSITYVFGSGEADGVLSGDGKRYDNTVFSDELYAVIKGEKCFGDSVMAFVQCFNGVFVIKGDENNQTVGTYDLIFTIGKNAGINRYVEYTNSIWLAEIFELPLHEGQGWDGPIITPQRARELYDKLGETAVTVEVYEGDIFDLGKQTYTHNGVVRQAKLK